MILPDLSEFPLDPALIYLNHAGVGPWPARARAAVEAFAADNVRHGATHYPDWLAVERRLRGQLATLIGAAAGDDIALLKNTSEGISLVAAGLDWRAGDNVVFSDQEFPSNRMAWEALAGRGVTARAVSLAGEDPEAALVAALDERTRVLAISAVQFGSGLKLDLARLGAACRANGTLFVVDAIQQIGALHFDVGTTLADVVIADGHKWMLGPEGVALFWVRPDIRDRIALSQFGWHMAEHAGDYNRTDWTPARSARRFECGSPNMLGIHALSASLSLLEETGMAEIERRVLENADRLARGIAALPGWSLLSRREPRFRSGIVTARHAGGEHGTIFRSLREAGVICAERGGGIRFSPHYYLTAAQLDRTLDIVEGLRR
ncbi:MAG: aminotransferase class V-fold PLP-dependent enzyme [Pseudomonadota bacterium]